MLVFREPTPDDYHLVADSFWRAARECPTAFGVGREFLVKMLAEIIIKPDWKCEILCDDNAQDEILCWAVWKSPVQVFWISAKPRYQGLRFGRKMIEHIGIQSGDTVSCPILPPWLLSYAGKNGIKLVQRPYMALI